MPVPQSIIRTPLVDLDLEVVDGAYPSDLTGEMVLSTPATDPTLPAVLFGFGAVVRISLEPGLHGAGADRFAVRSRVIDSPSKRLFDAAPDSFSAQAFGYTSPFGFPNQCNTAPLPWGDRLFATWDVGRPIEVDPDTLEFLGEVGHTKEWGDPTFPMGGLLPFYFTSAHPIVDGERNIFYSVKQMPMPDMSMQLHVVAWDGNGASIDMWPIEGATVTGSSHTVSQTRDWLILADSGNFKTDLEEMAGGTRSVTIDEQAPVYLVRKSILHDTPAGQPVSPVRSSIRPTTGHFYGVWDDSDGIRVVFEHMDLMDLGLRLQPDDVDANGRPIDPALHGFYNMAMAPNTCSEVHFDTATGESRRTAEFRNDLTFNLQLSAMDWSTEGLSAPTMHHIVYQGWRPGAVSERALDMYRRQDRVPPLPEEDTPGMLVSLRRDGLDVVGTWEYPDTGDHITSPTFAPRHAPGQERRYVGANPGGHDGYVIVPVLSDNGFRVEVFDAAKVGEGPVMVLASPDRATMPAMLHSAWMPSGARRTDHDRLSFADELDDDLVASLDPELGAAVHRVAADLTPASG